MYSSLTQFNPSQPRFGAVQVSCDQSRGEGGYPKSSLSLTGGEGGVPKEAKFAHSPSIMRSRRGGGGVSQKLTFAHKGGGGGV